jgi:hypothetical protein
MGGMGMGMSMGQGMDDNFGDPTVRAQLSGDVITNGQLEGMAMGPGFQGEGRQASTMESSLTSLDIELPERGVDFYFKSPRGKAAVIAVPIENRTFSRWASVAIMLGGCIVAVIACWLIKWICQKPVLRVVATLGLLLGGLISLGSAFLPVYGLIAVVASIVLLVDWTTRSIWDSSTADSLGAS